MTFSTTDSEKRMRSRYKPEMRFGRLVVKQYPHRVGRRYFVKCKCKCGQFAVIRTDSLNSGLTQSCGCFRLEIKTTHNQSNSRLYRIWNQMRQRCANPKQISYHNYGGRGITVCKTWLKFSPFSVWALSHGYADNLSIDRIKNNLGYRPSNCKWATRVEQRRNRRAL